MSVYIVKVGKWQLPINRIQNPEPHIHNDFYQLIFTQNSIGKLILDDAVYPFKPEHLYFTVPGVRHTCANTKSTQYLIFYFKILDPKFSALIDSLPNEFAPRDLMSCKQFLSQTAYEFSSGTEFGKLRANAYFELFLSAALDSAPTLLSTADAISQPVTAVSDSGIDGAANYIYNNFSQEISIDKLAEISNFERRQFFRIFKEKFGTSPLKYINDLRMNKAKTLLTSTNISVAEIAVYCGFKTEHYFSRAFKDRESVSPKEYRKNAAASNKEIVF